VTTTARSLLERLVAWDNNVSATDVRPIMDEARAYLASTKDASVAEGYAQFFRFKPDKITPTGWGVQVLMSKPDEGLERTRVRIPVPAHLLDPPVVEGEVIE
jgi:hypothetical protein